MVSIRDYIVEDFRSDENSYKIVSFYQALGSNFRGNVQQTAAGNVNIGNTFEKNYDGVGLLGNVVSSMELRF